MAAVLGSIAGGSAAIATTWISQKSQTNRERAKWETRKRETLYGDFITEASRLFADSLDHSLDNPETLVKLYATVGRIRLVSSDAVLAAAEECCDRILSGCRTTQQGNGRDLHNVKRWRAGSVQALQRCLSRRIAQVCSILNPGHARLGYTIVLFLACSADALFSMAIRLSCSECRSFSCS